MFSITLKTEEEEQINHTLKGQGISNEDRLILLAPGARSHIKRWSQDKFVQLSEALIVEFKVKIILAGDKDDAAIARYIMEHCRYPLADFTGQTTLVELAHLLKKVGLVITNDSAILHLASYLNRPVVAIFGPTDELRYGPWGEKSALVKKEISCRPCSKAQCRFGTLACMQFVQVEDVLRQVRKILNNHHHGTLPDHHDHHGTLPVKAIAGIGREVSRPSLVVRTPSPEFKRILVVRTDRIGDVVLSTPVIKALRDVYPHAYVAMMVSPHAKEVVEGNPYLDEVIVYDKEAKHKSWRRSLEFSRRLKKKKFDLALVLHPTNRVHWVTFLAGIKRRIGYNRKCGFLLTDKIPHTKQFGEKHELEYNLDLLSQLGIIPEEKRIFVPQKKESAEWVDNFLRAKGITDNDALLAINPGASCPSKIWPAERFAQAADRLADKYGFKIVVVAGPKELPLAEAVLANLRHQALNLGAKLSLSQLIALLAKCRLFISNDSGPVHLGSAVGVPVIAIFGRKQQGLSPQRWGPLGQKDKVLHKDVGCIQCLAHNCVQQFKCLQAISVDDVISAADSILK
jgi:heptosyltransferase-2